MIFNDTRISFAGWIAVGGACAALGACKVPVANPAAVYAAPETTEGLASVAFSGLGLKPGDAQIRIDSPVLNNFDATTQKRSCSANLSVAFGGSLATADPNKGNAMLANGDQVGGVSGAAAVQALTGLQEYSIQPSADGKALVYTLSQQLVGALQAWVLASKAAAEQQVATAPPAGDSPNPSDQTSALGLNAESTSDSSALPQFRGGSEALPPASYAIPVDHDTHKLLDEPNVATAMKRLLGPAHSDFTDYIDVADNLEQDASGVFGDGIGQHSGGSQSAAFYISQDGSLIVAIHNADRNPSIAIYGAKSSSDLPAKMKAFITNIWQYIPRLIEH